MGLLGTLLGGTVGFMFGGPFGAIIGGAIGSNLGGGGMGSGGQTRSPYGRPGSRQAFGTGTAYNPLQAQQAFMVALISLAAKVAKADGSVTREEIQSFDQFLQNSLRMGAEERKVAARIFNEARDSDIPVEDFARQIREVMGTRRDQLRDLVTMLMMVAMADGRLHPEEERVIREINRHLGLAPHDYDAARAIFNPTANLDSAYSTLGPDGARRAHAFARGNRAPPVRRPDQRARPPQHHHHSAQNAAPCPRPRPPPVPDSRLPPHPLPGDPPHHPPRPGRDPRSREPDHAVQCVSCAGASAVIPGPGMFAVLSAHSQKKRRKPEASGAHDLVDDTRSPWLASLR